MLTPSQRQVARMTIKNIADQPVNCQLTGSKPKKPIIWLAIANGDSAKISLKIIPATTTDTNDGINKPDRKKFLNLANLESKSTTKNIGNINNITKLYTI